MVERAIKCLLTYFLNYFLSNNKIGTISRPFYSPKYLLVLLDFLLKQRGRSSVGSLVFFSFICSRLDFTCPNGWLVGGGSQEFQQIDFADQPFTAVGVGGGFALAEVGGDAFLLIRVQRAASGTVEHVGAFSVKFL